MQIVTETSSHTGHTDADAPANVAVCARAVAARMEKSCHTLGTGELDQDAPERAASWLRGEQNDIRNVHSSKVSLPYEHVCAQPA